MWADDLRAGATLVVDCDWNIRGHEGQHLSEETSGIYRTCPENGARGTSGGKEHGGSGIAFRLGIYGSRTEGIATLMADVRALALESYRQVLKVLYGRW